MNFVSSYRGRETVLCMNNVMRSFLVKMYNVRGDSRTPMRMHGDDREQHGFQREYIEKTVLKYRFIQWPIVNPQS